MMVNDPAWLPYFGYRYPAPLLAVSALCDCREHAPGKEVFHTFSSTNRLAPDEQLHHLLLLKGRT